MKKTKKGSSAAKVAAIGVGVAGLAATAYFFLGPQGKKHQKNAKAWAIKMKAEVIEKMEMAHDITEPIYHGIIDSVAKEYATTNKASRAEIKALAQDLKKHWNTISGSAKGIKRDVVSDAKKVARKVKNKVK